MFFDKLGKFVGVPTSVFIPPLEDVMVDKDLVVYCNVLETFGRDSVESLIFKQRFRENAEFLRRAKALENLVDDGERFRKQQCTYANLPSLLAWVQVLHQFGSQSIHAIRLLKTNRFEPEFLRRAEQVRGMICADSRSVPELVALL